MDRAKSVVFGTTEREVLLMPGQRLRIIEVIDDVDLPFARRGSANDTITSKKHIVAIVE